MGYSDTYAQARDNPEEFWLQRAQLLDWYQTPERALSVDDNGMERWFADGVLNTCHNAVDRHVDAGRGQQVAIHYDSPVTGCRESITYSDLLSRVAATAGGLARMGVGKGDRVVIYMPMVPEAVIAMLACARLGAIHSVVFGGFAAAELAVRLTDAAPKVLLTATCGIEVSKIVPYLPIVTEALAMTALEGIEVVVLQRPQHSVAIEDSGFSSWADLSQGPLVDCSPVAATDPLYILYTSGTTGKPKGVVRDNGGHAVALAWSMAAVYGMAEGEVFGQPVTSVGWWVTPTSSTPRCSPGVRRCCTRANRSRRRMPGHSGAWSGIIRSRCCSPPPLHFAPFERKTPTPAGLRIMTSTVSRRCFSPGSGWTRRRWNGCSR